MNKVNLENDHFENNLFMHTSSQGEDLEVNQLYSIYRKSDDFSDHGNEDKFSESSGECIEDIEMIIIHPNFILSKDIYARQVNYPKPVIFNRNNSNKSFPECYFEIDKISESSYLNYENAINENFIENINPNYSENINIDLEKFNINSIFYNPGYCSCIIKEQNPRLKSVSKECKCFVNCILT